MKSISKSLAQDLGNRLLDLDLTVTIAESCTGGGAAAAITDIAGSSEWFEMGFVTYSNKAKCEMLGVQPSTLERYGAVSEHTVREMAAGALERSGASVAVAVSGIAGPTGGSAEKPIGTVWLAWASKDKPAGLALCHRFHGERVEIRNQAVMALLRGTIEYLK